MVVVAAPSVWLFIHPIDTSRYPATQPGWRWCVQLNGDPADHRAWLNAGWAPDAKEAQAIGEMVGVTVARGFQTAFSMRFEREFRQLAEDPTTVDIVFND